MAQPDEMRHIATIGNVTLIFQHRGNGNIGSRYTVDVKSTNLDGATGSVYYNATAMLT
jgi:hypothetical protein